MFAGVKFRELGNPTAGPALLEALTRELNDLRTWETQYQMSIWEGVRAAAADAKWLFGEVTDEIP